MPRPLVVRADGPARVEVTTVDGTVAIRPGRRLDAATSADVLGRTGRVARLDVYLGDLT